MFYRKYQPCEPLRKYIRHYWVMRGRPRDECVRSRDIPDGNIEVIINFGSPFKKIDRETNVIEYCDGGIKGQFDHAVIIEQTGEIEILGVSFWPWGFHPFVKPTMDEITNIAGPLELLIDSGLKDKLFEAWRSGGWVEVLDTAFTSRIDLNEGVHPILTSAVRDIVNAPSGRFNPEHYGLSLKSMQRLFKHKVGLTPKQFARVMRMRKLLFEISESTSPDWMKWVVELDFYDRSHLCKEFQSMVGVNPVRYFENRDTFSNTYSYSF